MGERLVRIVERAPERCGNDAGKIPVDAQTMRGDCDVYVALSADRGVALPRRRRATAHASKAARRSSAPKHSDDRYRRP